MQSNDEPRVRVALDRQAPEFSLLIGGVGDRTAGVVDHVAGVVDQIAGVVDRIAGVVDQLAGVVAHIAGGPSNSTQRFGRGAAQPDEDLVSRIAVYT